MGYKDLWDSVISGTASGRKVNPVVYRGLILPLFAILYLIIVIYTSYYHEVWRDEVRPLSLVIESQSLKHLFINLHNEGHPSLWYLILYGFYSIINNFVILKVASISVATLSICLFLSTSPFTLLQKVLFIFGYFPIYEYSVFCRSYGLSMLLLFCFCTLYPRRFKKIILLSIILFLLSQTNAHSLIIVISIYISFLIELIVKRKHLVSEIEYKYNLMAGMTLMAIGIVISIIQIYPDSHSVVFSGFPSAYIIFKSFLLSTILPGSPILLSGNIFKIALNIKLIITIFMIIAIWLTYIFLLRNPFILIIFFISVVGLGMFSEIVYPFEIRHKGFLFLLFIMAFWLDDREISAVRPYPTKLNKVIQFLAKQKGWFITLLLVTQVFIGSYVVIKEINTDFSSSKKAGRFINDDDKLKQAIIISEPDYLIESLPYYVTNQIYIPREYRFGKSVSFTDKNKRYYSLNELLNTAVRLKLELRKPILIFIGHKLTLEGPYEIGFPYERQFYYDRESLEKLNQQTVRIKSFQEAITDENYDVFLLN
jgi:hypothetical protein